MPGPLAACCSEIVRLGLLLVLLAGGASEAWAAGAQVTQFRLRPPHARETGECGLLRGGDHVGVLDQVRSKLRGGAVSACSAGRDE